MNRWFTAQLEGSYVGESHEKAPPHGERRHQLRVYRAALRDLRWVDPPAAPEERSKETVLRQSRVDHAHVAGVRGPGTWYEGPVFDLLIRGVELTHRTEHEGRPYGRIVGAAVGWLELPPEPVQPEVIVSEQTAPAAPAPPPEPLAATVYRRAPAASAVSGEPASPPETTAAPEPEEEAELPEVPEPVTPPTAKQTMLLPLTAAVVVVGLGLIIGCGPAAAGLWALFMLPTLVARRLFLGVLRDGGFIRGFGYACIALQLFCVSQLVSSAWATDCPKLALWPMLGVIAVLFPAGLLPSIIPLSCNAIGLALVLAAFGQSPSGSCADSKTEHGHTRTTATRSADPEESPWRNMILRSFESAS
ncbi:MAG TPA: hypothetical protein VJV78_46270 [Polyangiales bacterium]|nr:hypothetical protein [Polyangiales bacterium]